MSRLSQYGALDAAVAESEQCQRQYQRSVPTYTYSPPPVYYTPVRSYTAPPSPPVMSRKQTIEQQCYNEILSDSGLNHYDLSRKAKKYYKKEAKKKAKWEHAYDFSTECSGEIRYSCDLCWISKNNDFLELSL